MLILGKDGYSQLGLGMPINVNDCKRKAFTVASTETSGILPGDLLVATSKAQVYAKCSSGTDKVVGIAFATNVKVDPVFPQSSTQQPPYESGTSAGCLKVGEIAVSFSGTAPAEMDAVYYDYDAGVFTNASSGTTIALPNMVFSGITEGTLTVVNIRY